MYTFTYDDTLHFYQFLQAEDIIRAIPIANTTPLDGIPSPNDVVSLVLVLQGLQELGLEASADTLLSLIRRFEYPRGEYYRFVLF